MINIESTNINIKQIIDLYLRDSSIFELKKDSIVVKLPLDKIFILQFIYSYIQLKSNDKLNNMIITRIIINDNNFNIMTIEPEEKYNIMHYIENNNIYFKIDCEKYNQSYLFNLNIDDNHLDLLFYNMAKKILKFFILCDCD